MGGKQLLQIMWDKDSWISNPEGESVADRFCLDGEEFGCAVGFAEENPARFPCGERLCKLDAFGGVSIEEESATIEIILHSILR